MYVCVYQYIFIGEHKHTTVHYLTDSPRLLGVHGGMWATCVRKRARNFAGLTCCVLLCVHRLHSNALRGVFVVFVCVQRVG